MKYPSLIKRILTGMLVMMGLGLAGVVVPPQPAHAAANVTFLKSASPSTANAGDTVTYTIVASNSGDTSASGITMTDDLADVLDDAVYNNDAQLTGPGAVAYNNGVLTWTGNLDIGQTATMTFSVDVDDPVHGNAVLRNKLVSSTGNCQEGSTDLRCSETVNISRVEVSKVANTSTFTPGSTVQYTITIRSTGTADAGNVSLTDSLSQVLDDAVYNNDAQLTGPGAVAYNNPNLTYQMAVLSVGQTATITYSVTVNNPANGDQILRNTAVANQGNCSQGSTDTACTVVIGQAEPENNLHISKTVSTQTVNEGESVTFTITTHNNGTTAASGVFTDNLADVADDATIDSLSLSDTMDVTYDEPVFTFTFTVTDLAPGADAIATYTVIVNSPDTGNRQLHNRLEGFNCPPASSSAECSTTTTVNLPAAPNVTVTKTVSATQIAPGDMITYTITMANTGNAPALSFSLSDSLTQVIDDATYNDDAAATSGTAVYSEPNLTWTGDLQPNQPVTLTYSATAKPLESGDGQALNRVVSPALISNCATGSTDTKCSTTTAIQASNPGENPPPAPNPNPSPNPVGDTPKPKRQP